MTLERIAYSIELLSKHHNRESFSCGIEILDQYLQQHAGQEIRKYVATTFILTEKNFFEAIGYYTLASIAVDAGKLKNFPAVRTVIAATINDLKTSSLIDENSPVRYPGERVLQIRQENLQKGIPVDSRIWKEICNL